MKNKLKNKKNIYITATILLLIDQVVKIIVRTKMALYQEIKIIPNLFSLYYVENDGAAFSILGNQALLLIIIGIICLIVLNKFILEEKLPKYSNIPLGLLLGGILGNLIDRIIYQSVTDYLSIFIFKYSFPVFNIADIAICISAIFLIIIFIIEERNIKNSNYIQLNKWFSDDDHKNTIEKYNETIDELYLR